VRMRVVGVDCLPVLRRNEKLGFLCLWSTSGSAKPTCLNSPVSSLEPLCHWISSYNHRSDPLGLGELGDLERWLGPRGLERSFLAFFVLPRSSS
jgi:hypothetical protein